LFGSSAYRPYGVIYADWPAVITIAKFTLALSQPARRPSVCACGDERAGHGLGGRGYWPPGRSSAVIQPSSEAIRIPVPGMCRGSITSRSAAQNGP
jgi:hypothetical protein